MDDGFRFPAWLVLQWSRAALVCGVVVLLLLPVLVNEESRPLVLVASLLPVYMLHQYEEHAHGRFQEFFNQMVGQGRPVLTLQAIFWVNIGLVWAVFLVAFWLARFVSLDFALVPIYLTLVNGIIHVLTTLKLRRYNPGLWTSLVFFLPWGAYLLWELNRLSGAGWGVNLLAFLFAVAVHALIVVYALRRRAELERESGQTPGLAPAR